MSLFDVSKELYYKCTMDNLCNLISFCQTAFNHRKKVLCQGVTCKGMCGIPPSVIQEEKKRCNDQICACGRVKAAVPEGDPNCPQLVAWSIYDTKPVHFLSMACEKLKWMVMEKQVFNVDSGKTETMRFLHMNTIHSYSMTMGSVGLADQLCGNYHIDN
eukprot:9806242-Ditylum_brightwellii.AAC.1